MSEGAVRNYGYAGLVLTYPRVLKSVSTNTGLFTDLHVDVEVVQSVSNVLIDVARGIHAIGALIGSDGRSVPVEDSRKNRSKILDESGAVLFVGSKIEWLFNHAAIIGEDALSLLETMYGYLHRMTMDEPSEEIIGIAAETVQFVSVDEQ